jgi:Ca2+-dependent lipid-binding protein
MLSIEKSRKEALGEFESVEWLNHIVQRFWDVSEAGISSLIYNEVNNVLLKNTPGMLTSLRLTELTLGTRPPVVERIGFVSQT